MLWFSEMGCFLIIFVSAEEALRQPLPSPLLLLRPQSQSTEERLPRLLLEAQFLSVRCFLGVFQAFLLVLLQVGRALPADSLMAECSPTKWWHCARRKLSPSCP